jgi:hypothetical protein
MTNDMGNIIHKVIAPYVSQHKVELHFEELAAECWAKTVKMNDEGLIDRSRTRSEYFAQYKTAIVNFVCSLVQKYVFTEKRTGVKPPPKDKRHEYNCSHARQVEVRIDDPDANVQVSEIESGDDSSEYRNLLEEIAVRLSYIEQGVLNQLLSPNEEALFYARQEAELGRELDEPLRIRIRQEHLAKGIGLTVEQFHAIHIAIKQKCLFMKSQQEDDEPRYTAAMFTSGVSAATQATPAGVHLIYDSGSGKLYYDADANGAGAKVLVAQFSSHPAVTASDIITVA